MSGREPAPAGGFIRPGGVTDSRAVRLRRLGLGALTVLAGLGALLGLGMLWLHLASDPLVDIRAYYDAARRLNQGLPLYLADGDPTRPTFYFYPPLLAIALRPFAGLPFHVFALGWEAVVVASFVALLRRLGASRRAFIGVGLLGMPLGWALGVGQAQVPMTLLVAIGQPWSIALAANIKLFPILAAVWWLGRREFQAIGALVAWLILLGLVQWLLEPAGSAAFFSSVGLGQVAGVQNLSPYSVSPALWAVLSATGAVAAVLLAPSRWGWPAAVALATLTSPRLLVYMLTGLLAGLREPDPPSADAPPPDRVPDAAEAYVKSAR